MKEWVLVFSSVLLGVTGQLLMKKGMTIVGSINLFSFSQILKALLNPFVFSGFLAYGVSSIIWLAAISKLPLSNAYPVLSLGYIVVVFASYFFFGESLSLYKVLGVLLIASGVILIGKA